MEKLFFFDLETTGTKFWKNGIHQISGAVIINDEIKEHFDFKVAPNPQSVIEQEALDIAKVTKEQIMAYPPMKDVHRDIKKMLERYVGKFDKKDKFHLIGYNNASFDNQFFRAFFKQNGDDFFGSWFWADTIDIMVLASNHLRKERVNLENFKQATVAKYLGIDVDDEKLHDAEYDVEIGLKIFKIVG